MNYFCLQYGHYLLYCDNNLLELFTYNGDKMKGYPLIKFEE